MMREYALSLSSAFAFIVCARSLIGLPGVQAAEIPGPIGGPNVAVDVNTMIGRKGPSFTLKDGEGHAYTVTPGKGRPLVIISHMGYR